MIRPALRAAATLVALPAVALPLAVLAASADTGATDEIVVTARRLPAPALELAGNTAVVTGDDIQLINPTHFNELGVLVPGVWISRGSGQEHLTAIRSPVLTGPGSCGSFLILEDGIPIRPTGFCNVNELFELDAEQAAAVEVIRGPASALYGSNAVHGTINVLLPEPGWQGLSATAVAGPNNFLRGQFEGGHRGKSGLDAVTGGLSVDHDGGFREDSGYDQAKGFLKYARQLSTGQIGLSLTGSWLDQDTAGFIIGRDAYRDEALRQSNPDAGSYREASSLRLASRYDPRSNTDEQGWSTWATLRHSEMEFLQHFLPGKPVEENGQTSGGATLLGYTTYGPVFLTAGLDVEVANGFLKETQLNPEIGNPPRPAGRHYDYSAWQYLASPYVQGEWSLNEDWSVVGGLRLEWLGYDYDNRMLAGNTRDDGTPCLPNGCFFNRPADRTDSFTNLAPNIGLLWQIGVDTSAYLTLIRGFRAPQAAELYRLQVNQSVANLDPESIDSLELGWRLLREGLRVSTAAFAMRKQDYIFQDSNRFNVSNGKSRHYGVELDLEARADSGLYAAVAGTWLRQVYAFDQQIAGGETITDGNAIDTAPETLGSLRLGIERFRWLAEAQWVHQGSYYLTAEEEQRYPGHDLLNLRGVWELTPRWILALRLNNVTDVKYADRADFAFGDYRYFPGRGREAYFEVTYQRP